MEYVYANKEKLEELESKLKDIDNEEEKNSLIQEYLSDILLKNIS